MSLPKSRKEARQLNAPTYDTGHPCAHGHNIGKYTSSGRCITCKLKQSEAYYNKNTDKMSVLNKQYRKEHKSEIVEYNKQYRVVHAKKLKGQREDRYAQHRDRLLAEQKLYYYRTQAEHTVRNRKWRTDNKNRLQALSAEYTAAKKGATPLWYEDERADIKRLYVECKNITINTGVDHQVDHIIPLRGKTVCGLHCLDNLQILTATKNRQKSNKLS